jgi:hypothetical protein
MFDIRDIILFMLVIGIIYLLYKTKYKVKSEKFDQTEAIKDINDFFKVDMNGIRNLAKKINDFNINDNNNLNNIIFNNLNTNTISATNRDQFLNYFPKNTILAWNSSNIPSGWASCDGTGTGIPDLRGRFILGSSSNHAFGDSKGDETIILQSSNFPDHQHDLIPGPSYDFHNYYYSQFDCNGSRYLIDQDFSDNNPLIYTGLNGDGKAHENMPPFYILYFIIKL